MGAWEPGSDRGELSELLAGQRMSHHADFWLETDEVAARLDVYEPKLKHRIRPPCCLDDGAEPAHLATPKNAY